MRYINELHGKTVINSEQVVPWSQIQSLGDVIVIDSGTPLASLRDVAATAALRDQAFTITGLAVMGASGTKLGNVADIAFDDGGTILGFVLKHGLLEGAGNVHFVSWGSIQTIGRDAIITTRTELSTVREIEQAGGARSVGE